MIEKYSADEKRSANCASAGAKPIRSTIPTSPPAKDEIVVMNSATPALPFFDIG